MVLPSKHINFSQSLLGFGSYILDKLQTPISVDDLWQSYQNDFANDIYFAKHSFDNLILALVFLHSVNALEERGGVIYKCN